TGPVHAVTMAELNGRPVVISGSGDQTLRVWDLATGALLGGFYNGRLGEVRSLVCRAEPGSTLKETFVHLGVATGNTAMASSITALANGAWHWKENATPDVGSIVLALAWADKSVLVTGTELGIVVLDFPMLPQSGINKKSADAVRADIPQAGVDT